MHLCVWFPLFVLFSDIYVDSSCVRHAPHGKSLVHLGVKCDFMCAYPSLAMNIVGAPCAHRHTLLVHHDALNANLYQIFTVNIRQNDADILPQNIGKDHV